MVVTEELNYVVWFLVSHLYNCDSRFRGYAFNMLVKITSGARLYALRQWTPGACGLTFADLPARRAHWQKGLNSRFSIFGNLIQYILVYQLPYQLNDNTVWISPAGMPCL